MQIYQKNYIGIDVSKRCFDASLQIVSNQSSSAIIHQQFENTAIGMQSFGKWLKSYKVTLDSSSLVVIENTGVYHRQIWQYCTHVGIRLYIGNATDIKYSFGISRSKNDKIDSQKLCEYARTHEHKIKTTEPYNPKLLRLGDLHTARQKLVEQRGSIQKHIGELEQFNSPATQKELKKAYKAAKEGIDKSIKQIEKTMETIVKEDVALHHNYELLLSVPGIGTVTAMVLMIVTNNFERKLSGKQLASYAGVAPFEHSSGSSIRGKNRVHKMANKELKWLVHMGAMAAKTFYPEFRDYYDRKVGEGKNKMSVLNAIRNKILLRVAAVIQSKQPYQCYHLSVQNVENYRQALENSAI